MSVPHHQVYMFTCHSGLVAYKLEEISILALSMLVQSWAPTFPYRGRFSSMTNRVTDGCHLALYTWLWLRQLLRNFRYSQHFFFFSNSDKNSCFSRYTRHRHQIPIEALCSAYLSVSLGLYILNGICQPIPIIVSRFAYLFIP